MYIVEPMPQQIDADLIAGLLETDTGTVGHFLDSGFMCSDIRGRMPGRKIAGTAVTVRCTLPDSVIVHYALKFIRPGDVLVIDRGQDKETACLGGTTAVGAVAAGLQAVIMDCAGNDISQANAAGLALWCRAPTPVTTKYRNLGGAINVAISCGGVAVNPGDAILADENGVLVIRPDLVRPVVEESKTWHKKEADFFKALEANPGLCYPDATGASAIVEAALKAQEGGIRLNRPPGSQD